MLETIITHAGRSPPASPPGAKMRRTCKESDPERKVLSAHSDSAESGVKPRYPPPPRHTESSEILCSVRSLLCYVQISSLLPHTLDGRRWEGRWTQRKRV